MPPGAACAISSILLVAMVLKMKTVPAACDSYNLCKREQAFSYQGLILKNLCSSSGGTFSFGVGHPLHCSWSNANGQADRLAQCFCLQISL